MGILLKMLILITEWGRRFCNFDLRILEQGSPTSGIQYVVICGGVNVIIIEIKCTINIKHLNYPNDSPLNPDPPPPPLPTVHKKISTKLVPGAKKVGDCFLVRNLNWHPMSCPTAAFQVWYTGILSGFFLEKFHVTPFPFLKTPLVERTKVWHGRKSIGSGIRQIWVEIPSLQLICNLCVLGELFNL